MRVENPTARDDYINDKLNPIVEARETNKALLRKHIEENAETGSRLKELMQVLPALTKGQVQRLLQDLKAEGKVEVHGTRRAATWHPIGAGAIAPANGDNRGP